MKVVNASQMREIDRRTAETYCIPTLVLMENAGRAVAQAALRRLEEIGGRKVLIMAGKGNNGGDGLVAARHLYNQGVAVRVWLWADPGQILGDAAVNLQAAIRIGVPITVQCGGGAPQAEGAARVNAPAAQPVNLCEWADLVIDSLLGTGIRGPASGPMAEAIEAINGSGRPVLAVDLPSGMDSDSGIIPGPAVRARWTVTLGLPKIGLYLYPAAELAGAVEVADISLPARAIEDQGVTVQVAEAGTIARILPRQRGLAHKGDRGRVLIIAGSPGFTGAAALAGMAACRAGAGLVTVGIPRSLNPILEAKLTEPMTLPLPETSEGSISSSAAESILEAADKAQVVAAGPGLSTGSESADLVKVLIENIVAPLILDADALKVLAGDLGAVKRAQAPVILTPHPGEMAALLRITGQEVQEDRPGAVRRAASESGAIVLLKGAYTLIGFPDGRITINPTGNPALATGGTGDVLTGMIAGLVAQGMEAGEAAVAAAYLHGLAADRLGPRLGVGMVAGDLLDEIPQARVALQGGAHWCSEILSYRPG